MKNYAEHKVRRIITWIAGLIAVSVAFCLPLSYYALSYFYQDAQLETEVEINARIVTSVINENPEMWRYEELRLLELLQRRPDRGIAETRRVRDMTNAVIVESIQELSRPVHIRRGRLFDSGRQVGSIEISRSLRPLLATTGLLTLVGTILGTIVFGTLRTLPLRALREALRSLFDEKERLKVTLHSIADGVITTDRQGNITLLNRVAERFTGWTSEEARGRGILEVYRVVDGKTGNVCQNPVDQVMREMGMAESSLDRTLLSRNGTERMIADSGAPIRNMDGSISGAVIVFRDITEKRLIDEELQKAAKLESLGILAGGIAHDFNNLLTTVLGNVSLARMDAKPENRMDACLATAETGCLRAKELTRQLLTFAKGGMPVKKMVSPADLIRSSSDFVLSGSKVRPQIFIAENVRQVCVDAGQISQVLHNLLINAVDAMPEGGVISIEAVRVNVEKNSRLPLTEGAYVRFSVQDQGVGIPRKHLDRIFDPYFTTKQAGSGLGLATCYSIITKHGGHIGVTSEPGKGSKFECYLPASEAQTEGEGIEPPARVIRGSGTILVMDDEEAVRSTIGFMLSALGYKTVFTKDGREAVERYRNALSAEPFDAVILDLTIPGGMGGSETLTELRKLDSTVRAIVSSGYSDDPAMSNYLQHGFCGAICKPYDLKQLSHVLHGVLSTEKRNESTDTGNFAS